jgi:Fe-S cluster assembly protein SufD
MATATPNIEQNNFLQTVLQQFQAFEAGLNGQAVLPLHQLRRKALENLQEMGLPTTKHEEWKYTNLKNLLAQSYQLQTQADAAITISNNKDKLLQLSDLQDNMLVFVNGVFAKELSNLSIASDKIIIETFADACKKHPELVAEYFNKLAANQTEALTALNTAFAKQGLFVYIKANTAVTQPIFVQYLTDTSTANVWVQPRNLIVLEKNSQFTLIEKYRSTGENTGVNNVVTEIFVAPNARLDHYILQNDSPSVSHLQTTQAKQERDSQYHNTTVTLNGNVVRNNLHIIIDGENSEAYMNGLYAPTGNTHIDNHTLADHRKPHAYSQELYKGILDGKATGVFNGKIYVRQDAQKTNAFQSNRNILLSPTASINTKPQLEIWADDVKCSHGCTTGALDEEPMFYLRSRGIPETEARALLLFAFAEDVLEKIKVDSLRTYIESVISKRLQVNAEN